MFIDIDATYRDGAIHPDAPLNLPEGTPVRVHVVTKLDKGDTAPPPSSRFTVEEFRARIAKYAVKAPPLPPDFSREDIYSDHD